MKKVCSILLVLLMVLALIPMPWVLAETNQNFQLVLRHEYQNAAEDVVRVYFEINENTNIGSLDVKLNYNTKYLKWIPMEDNRGDLVYTMPGEVTTSSNALMLDSDGNQETPLISWVSVNGARDGGVLWYCDFQVLGYPKSGEVSVGCDVQGISHYDMDLPYTVSVSPAVLYSSKAQVNLSLDWEVKEGTSDIVRVYFNINEQTEIGALEVKMKYDARYLKWIPMKDSYGDDVYTMPGEVSTSASAMMADSRGNDEMGKFSWVSLKGAWDGGTLWYCEFRVLAYPENGAIPFTCEISAIEHYDDEEVNYDIQISPITITAEKNELEVDLHWERKENTKDIVRVYFEINENSNLGALSVELNYDTRYLQWVPTEDEKGKVVYVVPGDVSVDSNAILMDSEGEENPPIISWISLKGARESGVLWYCDFRVLRYPANWEIPFTCTVTTVGHYEDPNMNYSVKVNSTVITPTLGDVDENGMIDAMDALLVLRYSVGKASLLSSQKLVAEVDGYTGINAKDALEILKYAVDKIDRFPIEKKR